MWQDLYIHLISAVNPFYQAWKLFFFRNLKNVGMSFLGQYNVSPPGFQGISCSKLAALGGGLLQKLFKVYIFCFLGHLVGQYIFEPVKQI